MAGQTTHMIKMLMITDFTNITQRILHALPYIQLSAAELQFYNQLPTKYFDSVAIGDARCTKQLESLYLYLD